MKLFHLRSITNIFYICSSFLLLVLLVLTIRISIRQPYSELQWNFRSGEVTRILSTRSGASLIKTGDRILSIDGIPVVAARRFPGKRIGDTSTVRFLNNMGKSEFIQLPLTTPPTMELVSRLSFQIIAFSFWLLGVAVIAFGYHARDYDNFVLFTHLFAIVFSLGSVSSFAPIWMAWIFHLAEIWIAPVAIQVHSYLPRTAKPHHLITRLLKLLYILAGILSIFVLGFEIIQNNPAWVRTLILIWSGTTGLLLIFILGFLLFWSRDQSISATLIIVLSGLVLAFIPLVIFTILPDILFSQVVLPSSVSLAFMILIPCSYAFAFFRKELIPLEQYINYAVSVFMTATLVGGAYAIIFLGAKHLSIVSEQFRLIFELIIVLLLAWGTHPLFKTISNQARTVLYGPLYDEVSTIAMISDALFTSPGDVLAILVILGQSLVQTMQIVFIRIILPGKVILLDGLAGEVPRPQQITIPESMQFLENLPEMAAYQFRPIDELNLLLKKSKLSLENIACENAQTWLSIARKGQPLCLIVFGEQRGGKEFAQRDIKTLGTLFHQASVSIENAVLVEELELHTSMIRQLHQRLASTREEERKQLSHDLHDQIIQALVALNFSFRQVRRFPDLQVQNLDPLQDELHQILVDTRQICSNLRPPVMDTIGVVQLIRSRIFELRNQASFRISFMLSGNETLAIPSDCATILFSVFQEGIQNIRKHAHPSRVEVSLEIKTECLVFALTDNGLGFELPQRLDLFSLNNHFGLVGMRERVESFGGTFQIETMPGQGCRLECRIPLVFEKFTGECA